MQSPKKKPFVEHFKLFALKFNIPNPVTERDTNEYEAVIQTFNAGGLAMMAALSQSAKDPVVRPLRLVDPAQEILNHQKVANIIHDPDLEKL